MGRKGIIDGIDSLTLLFFFFFLQHQEALFRLAGFYRLNLLAHSRRVWFNAILAIKYLNQIKWNSIRSNSCVWIRKGHNVISESTHQTMSKTLLKCRRRNDFLSFLFAFFCSKWKSKNDTRIECCAACVIRNDSRLIHNDTFESPAILYTLIWLHRE